MPQLDDSELLAMYDGGISISNIAHELGMSSQTVTRVLKEHGKDTRHKAKAVDEDGVVQMYTDGKPVPEILAKHKIGYARLYKILVDHETPTRKVSEQGANLVRLDRAVQMYEAGAPLWSIKEETGISQPTLHAELHRRQIQLRRPRIL